MKQLQSGRLLLAALLLPLAVVLSDDDFADFKRQQNAQFQQYIVEDSAAYERFKAAVRAKWREFLESTRDEWVSYNGDLDRSSRVDFRRGVIIIEALVETHSEGDMNEARQRIIQQVLYLLSPDNPSGVKVLADQLTMSDGSTVTDENRQIYAEHAAARTAQTEAHFKGEDGVDRMRVRLEIPMVPDHLQKRAMLYQPIVHKYSEINDLDVATVMSLLSSQSAFNPLAVTDGRRFGLMQLDPGIEGLEVNRAILSDSTVLNSTFLYNPENNIRFGCAYLRIMRDRYFSSVRERDRQMYLLVATYYAGASGNQGWFRALDNARQLEAAGDSSGAAEALNLAEQSLPESERTKLDKVLRQREEYR